eukprot:2188621-Heterocapsa_arctica.AAC.1
MEAYSDNEHEITDWLLYSGVDQNGWDLIERNIRDSVGEHSRDSNSCDYVDCADETHFLYYVEYRLSYFHHEGWHDSCFEAYQDTSHSGKET